MAPETKRSLPAYDEQGSQWLLSVHGDGGGMTVRISDKSKNGVNPDWPVPYPCAELPIEDFAAYMEPETFWRDHKHTLGLHGLNPALPEGLHDDVSKRDVQAMRAWAAETLDRYRQMNQADRQKGDRQMDGNQKPKERIIFDEAPYYGQEGIDIAVEDLMSRDGLTEKEVYEEYGEHQLFEHAMEMRDFDYDEELTALTAFFDDGKSDMSSSGNPLAGNPVLVSGTIGRWDGTRSGITVYDTLKDALDTSPSRFGKDNVFADCEIQKAWDENGHLFLHGAHHDGSVTVEVRQLTDAGAEAYETIDDCCGEPFTVAGKTYDGSFASLNQAVHDLWENPDLAPLSRYMEQSFGCPAVEFEPPEVTEVKAPEVPVGRSMGKSTAPVCLSDAARESRAASQALSGSDTHDAPAQER